MKTLAIVGSHPRTRDKAPWDDKEIDIWVLNEAANTWARGKRVTGMLQLHVPELYQRWNNTVDPDHWAWLKNRHKYPIWMQEVDTMVPDCKRYPLEKVSAMLKNLTLNGRPVKKFTSSPAFALALALHLGYEVIKIYGMDMESNTEYAYQREGFLFWLGVASQKARIELHCCELLFNDPVYGYDVIVDHDPQRFKERAEELTRLITGQSVKYEEARGALEGSYPDFREALNVAIVVATELGNLEGRREAAQKYETMAQDMIDQGKGIIDRSIFEISSALQKPKVEEAGANVYRYDGRLGYVMDIYAVRPEPQVLDLAKKYVVNILDWARVAGKETGIAEENLEYMGQYDTMYQSAGSVSMKALYDHDQ